MAEEPMDVATEGSEQKKPISGRGILKAEFVENVEEFLAGQEVEPVLKSLEERLQQYKLLEMRLLAQRRDLQGKLPDIKKCLEIVQTLQTNQRGGEAVAVDFEVADGMYTQAQIQDASSVCLWLGANVMLEYPFDEALALLVRNKENAETSLANLLSDVHFLRDQTNITEVTIARVFNWDVAHRRKKKAVPALVEDAAQ